ncbi:prolipoprotein diacylglyceryl transferase [Aestuariivirga sp.]|uniref:prolipoprotein diacylglyceryl transferase n=1 Tax=Aestuariivirga sp. TaxID=2650926 RepID=UPI0035935AF3
MGYVHHIDPVMFSIAGFNVYWYGFAYTFGFAFMVLWLWWKRSVLGWSPAQVVNLSIVFVVLILAGGRIFDVIVYEWEWYRLHPDQIAKLWVGGMASHGLLAGSALAAVVASLWTRTPLLKLLDILTVAAAFIFGVGRIGNFIEGGVIGTVTTMPWGVKLPDVEGFRHPVSLYDGAKNLMLVPLLMAVLRRWPAGRGVATAVFLIGYGSLRFLVDQFRDYESALGGLGPGQWFNIGMAVFGVLILAVCLRRNAGTVETRPAASSPVPVLGALLILLLVLFPLSIPTSWTTEYIVLKRGAAAEQPAP